MSDNHLKQSINEDMKAAMKAKEAKRLIVIRSLLAAIKQKEIDEQTQLDDTQILSVIDKMVKQRKDSIQQFEQANRQDLIDIEAFEISILESYLPPKLSEEEISTLIQDAISQTNATNMQDMGKVMGILKPQLQGRADMTIVSKLIKEKLS